MIRPLAASALLLAAATAAAPAAEFFEGVWARSARECRERDAPGSGVLINLAGRENGKAAPLFDQYEHHCRIEKVERRGKGARLSLLCFEFWEDYAANREGQRESARLAAAGANRMELNGKTYQRCRP